MRDYKSVYETNSRTSGYSKCKGQENSRVLRYFDVCRAVAGNYGRIATGEWKCVLNVRETTENSWRFHKNWVVYEEFKEQLTRSLVRDGVAMARQLPSITNK